MLGVLVGVLVIEGVTDLEGVLVGVLEIEGVILIEGVTDTEIAVHGNTLSIIPLAPVTAIA